jgi:hypothetical protein
MAGAIGRITYFRGVSDEDYMADPAVPMSWRCRRDQAGSGALGDIGSHILSVALALIGPVAEVSADQRTVIGERPLPAAGEGRERRDGAAAVTAETAKVENEDQTHALLRFADGTIGTVATSRVAWGRKNHLAFEVFGTEGAILFDQERMNELQLYQPGAVPGDRNGFRTVLTGPAHPHYGAFSPAAGHGLGFNDLKVIEVAQLGGDRRRAGRLSGFCRGGSAGTGERGDRAVGPGEEVGGGGVTMPQLRRSFRDPSARRLTGSGMSLSLSRWPRRISHHWRSTASRRNWRG